MKEKLLIQLEFVQFQIDKITQYNTNLDIKQISDLQRYFDMQRNIVESLYRLNEGI